MSIPQGTDSRAAICSHVGHAPWKQLVPGEPASRRGTPQPSEVHVLKSLAAAMPVAVFAICALHQPANADWTVKVTPKIHPLGAPIIEVDSNGSEWTGIRSATRELKLGIDVKVSTGWRIQTVWAAVPNADSCRSFPDTPAACNQVFSGSTKHFKSDVMHQFVTSHISGIEANAFVSKCNTGNHDPTKDHSFQAEINVGIKAYILKRSEANDPQESDQGRTETAYAMAPVVIRCLAGPSMVVGPPKPASVDIRVKQTGDTCPKDAEVTAFIDYETQTTGRFMFVHNGKPGETIEIKAREVSLAGKTWYRIERLERYKLDPGKHSFEIKVVNGGNSETRSLDIDCPPFNVTSAWLKYEVEDKQTCPKQVVETATIHTNRPGDVPYRIETQGGLVVAQGVAHAAREGDQYVARRTRNLSMGAVDQTMLLKILNDPSAGEQKQLKVECLEVLSGTLDLRGFAANRCEGEAAIAIRTSGTGNVPYQLDCTGGRSWSRTAQAVQTGPNTYIGVDTVSFGVSNNEQVNCALKTAKPMPVKVLALKGRKYECHKSTGASASDELAPEIPPVDPPVLRTLTGDFSFVDNGGTRCPRQGKALINFVSNKPDNVHYSLDCTNGHFSGVAQTAPGPKGGFVAPALVSFDIASTTKANCVLKTVAPGKPKVHTLKGHMFQCVKSTGVAGPGDLAPETGADPKRPDKPGLVIVDPPRKPDEQKVDGASVTGTQRITCANGTVKGGACVCARTHKPVKAGNNAFRCVPTVVIDPVRPGSKAGTTVGTTPDKGKSGQDAAAERRRLEALKKAQDAKKRAAAERKQPDAAKMAAPLNRTKQAVK